MVKICFILHSFDRDLNLVGAYRLDNRPPLVEVQAAFRSAKYVAFVASLVLSAFLVFIWPSIMVAVHVMAYEAFYSWVSMVTLFFDVPVSDDARLGRDATRCYFVLVLFLLVFNCVCCAAQVPVLQN
ncbi:hypothetical protein DPMN_096449 [Dreissena polymorpha]|uniref:Uncharacterized protein n=1 Tax=Dreissena polymorpha TaxID=45954 RepID=A0A9D4L966_DREPO|nr:hypothetical protein DPMN_096449 [Dreissena polymorpha]